MTDPITTISLCMPVMNRLAHVEQTLLRNLTDNVDCSGVEFVLLDYNSSDGLEDWIRNCCQDYLKSGSLVYYRENSKKFFDMSHAKNLAHKLARNGIVCELDIDNFTGHKFATDTISILQKNLDAVVRCRRSHGRIAMLRQNFLRLGGYNEQFVGRDTQDNDLVNRALAIGMKLLKFPRHHCHFIKHSDTMRCENLPIEFSDIKKLRQQWSCLSAANIAAGKFVANEGTSWGTGVVCRNFKEMVTVE